MMIALCVLSPADWQTWLKFAGPAIAGASYVNYTEVQAAATAALRNQGYEVVEIEYDHVDFNKFCAVHNIPASTPEEVVRARAAWAGAKARELTCLRCGHHWVPRSHQRPARCGGCKSPYWDTPRKKS